MNKTSNIFVISAPSGGGKTSLVNGLLEQVDNLRLSISYTTRDKREGEEHGKNYYFVKEDEFKRMQSESKFIEDAEVFGNYYGTAKEKVTKLLDEGIDVVLEIDWQGAKQIKENFPEALLIFVLPPGLDTLKQRLESRAKDDSQTIQRRLSQATHEISNYKLFDYLVVNDDFNECLGQIISIVNATRLKRSRRELDLRDLLKKLIP
ncbi:MAG: guanylate kinase [Candidatus Portiera sp.]|nr:guanylate kinase [Portiera sp.]